MTRRIFGLIGAAAAAAVLLQATPALADPPPHAKAWGYRDRSADGYYDRGDYRTYDRDDYRYRDRYDDRDDRRYDRDCDRGRYDYPRPVYYVPRLPRGYRIVYFRGLPHYYHRHVWYVPYRGRYGIIEPPRGLVFDRRGGRDYVDAYDPARRW